jgi:hypothetical protein
MIDAHPPLQSKSRSTRRSHLALSLFVGTIHFENGEASLRALPGDNSGILPLPLVLIDPDLSSESLDNQLGAAFAYFRQTLKLRQDQQVNYLGQTASISGVDVLEVSA